jgi:hypothetical protein
LNYRLAKRRVLLDFAMKPVTVVIQLRPYPLKPRNEMINLMNRLGGHLSDQRRVVTTGLIAYIWLFFSSQYMAHIEFDCICCVGPLMLMTQPLTFTAIFRWPANNKPSQGGLKCDSLAVNLPYLIRRLAGVTYMP